MFCSNCGSRLVEGAKFCSECGARVSRPEEPVISPFEDMEIEEPEFAKEPAAAEAPAVEETPVKPAREKVSFDWSNVVDEPHRKEIKEIKSPWGTTGSIDEKELYAEMTPSTDRSRTMSFIDVLKAEKEEKEKAAADKAIEYTEVLHFDPDLTAFDEAPQLHMAPLYDDVDEPVKTPFDEPEFTKPEPVFEEEPRFEEPVKAEEPAEEPEEPSVEVSKDTIAQFDEYVKSFEREAGISSEPEVAEPVFEEPVYEDPMASASKFELPDFLKKITDSFKEPEPEYFSDEPSLIELKEEIDEPEFEEPAFEEPAFEEPAEPVFEEPAFEESAAEEPAFEEPAAEEPVFEEPAVEETAEQIFEEVKEPESKDSNFVIVQPQYVDDRMKAAISVFDALGSAVFPSADAETQSANGVRKAARAITPEAAFESALEALKKIVFGGDDE